MKILDFLLACLVVFIWASDFPIGKVGVSYYTPLLFLSARSIISFIVTFPFIKSDIQPVPLNLIIFLSFSQFLMHSGLFIALWLGIDISLSIILMQMSVPFSLIFAFIYYNEKISWRQILGVVITFFGVVIAVGDIHIGSIIPILFVLLSALGLAWFNLLLKIYPEQDGASVISYSSFGVFILFTPLSYFIEDPYLLLIRNAPLDAVFSVIYLGVMSVFAWFIWYYLLGKYKLSMISPFQLLVPVCGIVLSTIIFEHSLTMQLVLAIIIVFVGHVITMFASK